MVTAQDAEGVDEQVSLASEIETWAKGIAFNYEDRSVIQNQRFGPISWLKSPLLICLTTLPPIAYFLLLAGIGIARRRSADPFAARARKAYGNLTKSLKDARRAHSSGQVHDIVLDAFRNYLGDKLRMPKGALTFNDVKDKLATKGMDAVILDQLKELFETCEAGCYAGASCLSDAVSITEKGLNLAKNLEKKLK